METGGGGISTIYIETHASERFKKKEERSDVKLNESFPKHSELLPESSHALRYDDFSAVHVLGKE